MRMSIKLLLAFILFELIFIVGMNHAFGQTATVTTTNTEKIPYDGNGIPVHLAWGPSTAPAGYTVHDYCVGSSDTAGQEHAAMSIGTTVYKGCGTHAMGTTFDVFPPIGPRFYVIWAELISTDGTKVSLSADSNEASCDLEVLSSTPTSTTFFCKGQTPPTVPGKPTGLTATPK